MIHLLLELLHFLFHYLFIFNCFSFYSFILFLFFSSLLRFSSVHGAIINNFFISSNSSSVNIIIHDVYNVILLFYTHYFTNHLSSIFYSDFHETSSTQESCLSHSLLHLIVYKDSLMLLYLVPFLFHILYIILTST